MDDWEEYGYHWQNDVEGFVSCNPITMNGWVFKISALNGNPMVFAMNYYTEDTLLMGFKDIPSAHVWIEGIIKNGGDDLYVQ
jgi:hypothetical protein|tara:strand:+ start:3719 stop:3964 length:246 start_codon:yes stop_codon:yes gene_type:complete